MNLSTDSILSSIDPYDSPVHRDLMDGPTRLESGLKRLAAALLLSALEDLTGPSQRRRGLALTWVSGRGSSAFSFDLCCHILGREPDYVRERLKEGRSFYGRFGWFH